MKDQPQKLEIKVIEVKPTPKGEQDNPNYEKITSRLMRALFRMVIAFVNFLPSILTWYSIISITGVNPTILFENSDSKGLILPILIIQCCWILIYLIGILAMTFQNLNWWQMSYQIEAVKEDRLCRIIFFTIGCSTFAVQIKIWTHFREVCGAVDHHLSSLCSDLGSPMTFTTTCILAAFGLYSISTYNGGLLCSVALRCSAI